MPRYFFDIHDAAKGIERDDDGIELADIEMVRRQAETILPDIARDEIPGGGDQRMYTVLVTDEDGAPVYSASLTYAGQWLLR